MNRQHSYWLDFERDEVACSRFGCKEKLSPSDALVKADLRFSLEIAHGKLKVYHGKVYVIKMNGEYLCSITGYTHGVLHLLDFVKPDQRDVFKEVVSKCFGVNHLQIQEELKNVEKTKDQ